MIDWMAMNGINTPLMPIGHEAVQRKMLADFKMSDSDWLPGPAFLSWARMGNLQKWVSSDNFIISYVIITQNFKAGPPSDIWIEDQLILGKKIINRMVKDFGMDPVVPSFCGFLPDSFQKENILKT